MCVKIVVMQMRLTSELASVRGNCGATRRCARVSVVETRATYRGRDRGRTWPSVLHPAGRSVLAALRSRRVRAGFRTPR